MENNEDKYIEEIRDMLKEKIGYKKPPKSGQFKKGQSGNPAGRKKKVVPKSFYDVLVLYANEMKTVKNENGVPQRQSMYEILARKLLQDAVQKESFSRKFILENFFKVDMQVLSKSIIDNLINTQEETVNREKLQSYLLQKLEAVLKKEQKEQEEKEKNNDNS